MNKQNILRIRSIEVGNMGLLDLFKKKVVNEQNITKEESELAEVELKQSINASKDKELLGAIANKASEMIPDEWEKIYLYGEVLSDSREVYFYFKKINSDEIIYSHDIPKKYHVDKGIYYKLLLELINAVVELHDEYKLSYDNEWTNLTLILEKSGHFNVNYNYDDVLDCQYTSGQRQIIWKYEVVGIEPILEEHKQLIEKYLANKS